MSAAKPTPPDLSKGVSYGYMPVTAINAGLAAARHIRGESHIKINRTTRGGGSGGGGNGSLTRVMVYSDLTGATADTAGLITLGADVQCLPVKLDGAAWTADLDAAFLTAKVWSLGTLELSNTDCCGGETTTAPTGILIDTGLGADGNDRVYDGDASGGAVVVTGTGVAAEAVVTVTITDGTNTITPTPVVNNGDGTWTAPAANLAAAPFTKGVVKITATDGATTDVRIITYSGTDNGTEIGHFTGRPTRPDMTAATDLGVSDTDNRTSDTTPTFSCAHGGVSPIDGGGPIPQLYSKGVLVAFGSIGSYTTTPPVISSVDLTPASPLDPGYQNLQLVLQWTDTFKTFYSPPSLPLRINIDEDAVEETEPAKRYARLGWLTQDSAGYWVTVDQCPRELSDAEITKLDA